MAMVDGGWYIAMVIVMVIVIAMVDSNSIWQRVVVGDGWWMVDGG